MRHNVLRANVQKNQAKSANRRHNLVRFLPFHNLKSTRKTKVTCKRQLALESISSCWG